MTAPVAPRGVVITGAAGFLGKLARAECEELGFRVLGLDLAQPRCQGGPKIAGTSVADSSNVDRATEDLSKEGAITGLFDGYDTVIHLAADGRPSADFVSDVLPSNIEATFRVLEEAKRAGVRRVIFASTNHTQHGATMERGGHAGSMEWGRLDALGGPGTVRVSDPLGRAGPDSFYAVSKVCGEAMGYLYSRVQQSFEFVALRIGWCLYDNPTDLKGTDCEDYLRSMFLSQRDFRGFIRGALLADLEPHQGFLVAYAVSRNGRRVFDIEDSVSALGYDPVDDAESHYDKAPAGSRKPAAKSRPRQPSAAALGGVSAVLAAVVAGVLLTRRSRGTK